MKHTTRYLFLLFLLVMLVGIFLLAPAPATNATQIEERLPSATQTPTLAGEIIQGIITATPTPTFSDDPLVVAQAATATRTPTPINIGNFVWDDVDGDGNQDAGEPGLSGITVQLWNSARTQMLDTDVTDALGSYTVTASTPGNYRLRVLLLSVNDQFSPKDQAGGSDTLDSDFNTTGTYKSYTDIFNIATNVISMTSMDAGIIRYVTPTPTRTPTPINIGNFVWNDVDGDGYQDPSEPGLGGITVQLWNSSKTSMYATTTTNASGIYTVVAPLPGDYRIRVVPLSGGDQFTTKYSLSASETSDSDINASGPDKGYTDVFTIPVNTISIVRIDAGLSIVQLTPTPSRTPTITPTVSAPYAAPLRNYTNNYIVKLSWNGVDWATGYTLQVDNNANFSSPEYSLPNIAASSESTFALLPYTDALYYWRVGAKAADSTIRWSTVETFRVDIP